MEWRCEWCGKPHEENDPPCDNCGHGKFEKAIVRQTDLAEGGQEATIVWTCTECGRSHPKHAPPCSRCGNTTLEKERQHVDESELSSPGYLELLTPQYAAVLAVTLLLAGVVLLGLLGVVDLPGFDSGAPDVENVPGNATDANGISHGAIESAYVATLNEERENRQLTGLERTDGLDDVATYYNQHQVKGLLAGGDGPDSGTLTDLLAEECRTEYRIELDTIQYDAGDDAAALGERLATERIERADWNPSNELRLTGVDVHSANGQLFLAQFVCDG